MIEGNILAGRHFPHKKPQHTLSELLDRYVEEIMPRKTPETQLSHHSVIVFWRERLGHKLLTEITRAEVIKYKNELRDRAPATIHKYLSVLSHVISTGVREYEWLETNVVSTITRPTLPPGKVRFLSDEERCRLLAECRNSKNPYLYALVSLALYTGLRRGALLHLTRENIDLKNRILCIEKTKNKSTLVLPIVGEAYNIINDLCSQKTTTCYIFPGREKRGRWGSYRSAFEEAVKRADIPNFSFHSIRHSSASYMIQAGVSLYTVGTILNHKRTATTTIYAHLQTKQLKEALEILAQRLEG